MMLFFAEPQLFLELGLFIAPLQEYTTSIPAMFIVMGNETVFVIAMLLFAESQLPLELCCDCWKRSSYSVVMLSTAAARAPWAVVS
jgi:hypothetical protein